MTKGQQPRPASDAGSTLSIVIPVLNEAALLGPRLAALASLKERGAEIIVVDGGSFDTTVAVAAPYADHVTRSARGRAAQMNAGALLARADILLFLHADTQLPDGALGDIGRAMMEHEHRWGRFDVAIEGLHPLLPIVAAAMSFRSRLTGIATGDQAIFVRRQEFEAVGGFPPIALMEDVALSTNLRRRSTPVCLKAKVITSGRRWDDRGFMRTVLLMWSLRLAFALGARPELLARLYGYR